jgi:alpha-glucosidase
MIRPTFLIKSLTFVASIVISVHAASLSVRDTTPAACPGYRASNIQTNKGTVISADLNLAGVACNVYGTDLDNLRLVVEYQNRAFDP